MSLVNFEMAMIIGCWSAVNVLFWTIVILILLPMAFYAMYKQARARDAQIERVNTLKRNLVSRDYSPEVFPAPKECIICFCDFELGDKVTPLPCNKLHIYHTECIKANFDKTDNRDEVCPMCRAPITSEDCADLNRRFDEVYPTGSLNPKNLI